MQAIITTHVRKGGKFIITARTASGKRAISTAPSSVEQYHRQTAHNLSVRMGWGDNLVGGETRDGFAYVVASRTKAAPVEDMNRAVKLMAEAARAFPNADPIRVAGGIANLASNKVSEC